MIILIQAIKSTVKNCQVETILKILIPIVMIVAAILFALVSIGEGKTMAGPYVVERCKQPYSFWLATLFPPTSMIIFFSLALAGIL